MVKPWYKLDRTNDDDDDDDDISVASMVKLQPSPPPPEVEDAAPPVALPLVAPGAHGSALS